MGVSGSKSVHFICQVWQLSQCRLLLYSWAMTQHDCALLKLRILQLAALNQLVTDGIASGEVKPLPVTVYNRTEVEEAFRYLASGQPLLSLPSFHHEVTIFDPLLCFFILVMLHSPQCLSHPFRIPYACKFTVQILISCRVSMKNCSEASVYVYCSAPTDLNLCSKNAFWKGQALKLGMLVQECTLERWCWMWPTPLSPSRPTTVWDQRVPRVQPPMDNSLKSFYPLSSWSLQSTLSKSVKRRLQEV